MIEAEEQRRHDEGERYISQWAQEQEQRNFDDFGSMVESAVVDLRLMNGWPLCREGRLPSNPRRFKRRGVCEKDVLQHQRRSLIFSYVLLCAWF